MDLELAVLFAGLVALSVALIAALWYLTHLTIRA
jgi:hypothetical protein